jgi:hypothetical protein
VIAVDRERHLWRRRRGIDGEQLQVDLLAEQADLGVHDLGERRVTPD